MSHKTKMNPRREAAAIKFALRKLQPPDAAIISVLIAQGDFMPLRDADRLIEGVSSKQQPLAKLLVGRHPQGVSEESRALADMITRQRYRERRLARQPL